MAYHITNADFNWLGSFQQERTKLQLSCMPAKYAPMLGSKLTNVVGLENLSLSFYLSIGVKEMLDWVQWSVGDFLSRVILKLDKMALHGWIHFVICCSCQLE